jgi:hypothetical protein
MKGPTPTVPAITADHHVRAVRATPARPTWTHLSATERAT